MPEHQNSKFSQQQYKEIEAIASNIHDLSASASLHFIFKHTHSSIALQRNRCLGGSFANGFKGRARLPFFREHTFQSSIERLLSQDILAGFQTFDNALKIVTQQRFKLESCIAAESETMQNMRCIESLTL